MRGKRSRRLVGGLWGRPGPPPPPACGILTTELVDNVSDEVVYTTSAAARRHPPGYPAPRTPEKRFHSFLDVRLAGIANIRFKPSQKLNESWKCSWGQSIGSGWG